MPSIELPDPTRSQDPARETQTSSSPGARHPTGSTLMAPLRLLVLLAGLLTVGATLGAAAPDAGAHAASGLHPQHVDAAATTTHENPGEHDGDCPGSPFCPGMGATPAAEMPVPPRLAVPPARPAPLLLATGLQHRPPLRPPR